MATVSQTLGVYDRFTQPLQRYVNKIMAATVAAERFKRVVEAPMNMSLNTVRVESELASLRTRIASSGGSTAMEVMINVGDITQKITQIQQRIRSGLTSAAIDVTINSAAVITKATNLRSRLNSILALPIGISLNTASVLGDVTRLRTQIIAQIGVIESEIRITLPSVLTDMLQDLRRLVLLLTRAIRNLRRTLTPPPIPPIPPTPPPIPPLPGGGGAGGTGGWLSNLKGIAAAYLSIASAQKLVNATFGGAMQQMKMEDMFKARTGDDEVGTAMFEKFKAEALAAGQDVNEALKGTLSFFSTTQNTDQLSELNKIASRMAAFDSAGNGIEGAAFALKEAMSGDIVSLAERFNMSKTDIRAFKIDELGKAGDMDGFINAFNQLLEKQKMGEEAFERMMASPAKQAEVLGNNVKSAMADAGGAAVATLMPLITMLNDAFQEGKFQPFFDGLSNGLAIVTDGLVWLVDNAMWLTGTIVDNWPTIEPIILGIAGALAAWKIATIAINAVLAVQNGIQTIMAAKAALATGATIAQTAAQWGLNAALLANPITWIVVAIVAFIAAIVALVMYIIKLWKTNDEFAAAFLRAWNTVLGFMDKVGIFFAKVWYGIANAADAMKVGVLQTVQDMVNTVIDDVNKLIDVLNKTGVISIEAIGHVQFGAEAALEAEAKKQARAADVANMEKDAAQKAADREQKVLDMLNDRAKARAEKAAEQAAEEEKKSGSGGSGEEALNNWNKGAGAAKSSMGDIDKVKEVGKIKDTVDISSEDLKTMRELAEMKNIQNFVTLTPSVQVTTGPVTNGADVDSMISKIDTFLSETIASSAKGVYG